MIFVNWFVFIYKYYFAINQKCLIKISLDRRRYYIKCVGQIRIVNAEVKSIKMYINIHCLDIIDGEIWIVRWYKSIKINNDNIYFSLKRLSKCLFNYRMCFINSSITNDYFKKNLVKFMTRAYRYAIQICIHLN